MEKCSDCSYCGALTIKKGGWFRGRASEPVRVTQPCIPYCIKLNMAVTPNGWVTCEYFSKFTMPEEEPKEST